MERITLDMSRSIVEAVLFSSRHSRESVPCEQIITRAQLPVVIVRLDTAAARESAVNGANIQIRSVPSLLVSYNDGTVQMYVGRPKIVAWFQTILQPRTQQPLPPPDQIVETPVDVPKAKKPKSKSAHSKKKKHPKSKKSIRSRLTEPVEYLEPEGEEDEGEGGTEIIGGDEGYEPVELIMEEGPRPSRPPAPSMKGFSTTPKGKPSNGSLMAAARKMMEDRDNTLGYKADK